MNRKYNLKLDLQFRCNNSTMKFNQFDNNTSDFFIKISNGGKSFDVEKAIVVLAIIKPSGKVASQFVKVKNDVIYADLKASMKDEIGTYTAKAMLILEDERVVTDSISYEVEEDKIFSLLNDTVGTSEEFTLLTDMLSRLSAIEISEEQRMINEAERILSEENRKIEEAKRIEAELIRQHEEADRAKYDATRESNENIRKQNESIRLANETNRIDEEAKRVEEENKRKLAEEERNANYNFMTEDEERRRSEANSHKEAEKLRVQAETNRVNEEAKRRTTEQARVSAENTRVSNENTRKANETTRQNNETQRVEAETQRQNRYNSFIADAEANANNFENYTNSAKVKEEERKANELDRKSQEDRRVSNEVERISNENTRKANEKAREKNETSRQYVFENKVNEVDKKIVELNTTKDNFVSNINTKVDTKISELNTTKDNFVSSISTKVDSKISELDSAKSDMATSINNKVNEVENRFNALTSKQQQDAEVIDARDGETSLKARLDRDIEKAKQVYVDVEGSHISSDSSVGYAKDVEILGNTVQSASNLADIRSVGDKVEGQELYEIPVLSVGKNLIDYAKFNAHTVDSGTVKILKDANSIKINGNGSYASARIKLNLKKGEYIFSKDCVVTLGGVATGRCFIFIDNKHTYTLVNTKQSQKISLASDSEVMIDLVGTWGESATFDATFNVQLEEGTIATPYEPYIEDKLTILSPVQIEKVGDVRDRIIEKGGVWGVEKNVDTAILNGNEVWSLSVQTPYNRFLTKHIYIKAVDGIGVLSSKYKSSSFIDLWNNLDKESIASHNVDDGFLSIRANYSNVEEFKNSLKSNNILIKYIATQPQFIPLPHDQQIKLRTFANKTNISFLTEIEGTIKAQVPKSLGATVNTHTEQISNLNNELNRVKKLEENTVSTITTESDFTTVEATNNGYFEDVKLEGKTLVNLAKQPTNNGSINHQYATISTVTNIKPSTEYTYIIRNNGSETLKLYLNHNGGFDWFDLDVEANSTVIGKAKTLPTIDGDIWLSLKKAETVEQNLQVVLLEGDHTQNPPSYFEGLKSVGQSATTSEDGVDEIVVSSVKGDGNLFDGTLEVGSLNASGDTNWTPYVKTGLIRVKPSSEVVCKIGKYKGENATSTDIRMAEYDMNKNFIKFSGETHKATVSDKTHYVKFAKKLETSDTSRVDINAVSDVVVVYGNKLHDMPHQSDKKRLLYYNEETQTWEKPILRQWDSIEKHANGKYYYHQRSGKAVLNGSESWTNQIGQSAENTLLFTIPNNIFKYGDLPICDLFNPSLVDLWQSSKDYEGLFLTSNGFIQIRINKSKLPTQDLQGFKQWLQANNATVVYQLAEEKVYECTNIDLITYANETNFIVESSALSPKTTLKVHSNISNVVSLLQKKVSLLESNVKASQEVQDMMILETDMRMLDIELALMEFIPMKLNLGGSNMLRSATYFNFLKNHIINETYEKEYLENVMNKYLATGRINQDEYNELYKMLYPPVYDIELPIEY